MLKVIEQVRADAESGKSLALNKNIIAGQADMLINTDDSLLSFAFDPGFVGQSWVQDYAQGNPNEDLSWAMPESDQYDRDKLEDEVHGWLTDKLRQVHINNAPPEIKTAESIHEDTMESIASQGYSKDKIDKEEEKSPMVYKTPLRAQELIKKYS